MTTGSEWHEAVVRVGLTGNGGPAHGAPERWDWGYTLATLEDAIGRARHRQRMIAQLTPQQRATMLKSEMR